jgi:hypothetical protein
MREGAGRKSKEIKNNQKNQNDYFEKIENQKKSNEIKNNQNDQKEKKTPLNPEKNKNIYIPENNKLFSAPSNDDGTIDLEELIAKTPPKPKSKSFTPPTLEDVKAYIAERDCAAVVDAKKFFDYFEAGHWHDSEGKPVRNWKQKLITWETHGRQTRTLKAAQGLLGVKSGTYAEDVPL